ncbi:MAG: SMI1/KNR4 family protein [Burkholderiales bacterium]|nr:SMI1/KNR4 family protein [Burkholderiales bacterium]
MEISKLIKKIDALPKSMYLEFDGKTYKKTYKHTFSPGLNKNDVVQELLRLWVPLDILEEGWQDLYQISNGIKLFHSESEDVDTGEYFIPSIELHPLGRLAAETGYMQSEVFQEIEDGDDPPVYSKGVAIGEACGTGNRFILNRWGELSGNIIYADHDPDINEWHTKAFSSSLVDFLEQLSSDPFSTLSRISGADKVWF